VEMTSEHRQELPSVPVERLERYDQPVLYATNGQGNIWHIPRVEDGQAQSACGYVINSPGVTSLSLFRRRRNHRICEMCDDGSGEYPDTAPVGDTV